MMWKKRVLACMVGASASLCLYGATERVEEEPVITEKYSYVQTVYSEDYSQFRMLFSCECGIGMISQVAEAEPYYSEEGSQTGYIVSCEFEGVLHNDLVLY